MIKTEHFQNSFWIDSNTSSVSLLSIINSAFEDKHKVLYYRLCFTKTKSGFSVLLFKELVEFLPSPATYLLFLECFIVTEFMSIMVGFFIFLGC